MEAQWQADRSMLRTLLRTQPAWTHHDYADAVGRSLGWVRHGAAWFMPAFGDASAPLGYATIVIVRAYPMGGNNAPHQAATPVAWLPYSIAGR